MLKKEPRPVKFCTSEITEYSARRFRSTPGSTYECGKIARYMDQDGRWYCKAHFPPARAARIADKRAVLERLAKG